MNKQNKSGSWKQFFGVGLVVCIMTFMSLSPGWGANLIINGISTSMCGSYTFDTVIVTNNGRIYVTPYDGATGGWLNLHANQYVSVLNGGAIVADTAGYRGSSTGNGEGPGGGQNGAGAGYGGKGSLASGETTGIGISYGNWSTTTIEMGSGGADATNGTGVTGGNGGGAITIDSKTINVASGCSISSNGGDGQFSTYGAGGGSGGGILLSADTIIINGQIRAKGGLGGGSFEVNMGGSGSGGRIKLIANKNLSWSVNSACQVTGGYNGFNYAEPGTVYPNTFPILAWAGTTGFTSDGINPDLLYNTTISGSTITYQVKYTDNDSPAPAYPKVHILKSGTEVNSYLMSLTSGINSTGAIYSFTTVFVQLGNDYGYWFEGFDVLGGPAYGSPTIIHSGPIVQDVPQLSWTMETGYESDGVNPNLGFDTSVYTYRVKYTDVYNHPPASGYPRVHILRNSADVAGSPFTMNKVSGVYNTGATYSFSTDVFYSYHDGNYTYYFEANDSCNWAATGIPTTLQSGPGLNHNPTLTWAGDSSGYLTDGINSDHGIFSYYHSGWTTMVNYPLAVSDMGVLVYQGRLWGIGGYTASSGMVNSIYSMSISTTTSWRAENNYRSNIAGAAFVQMGERIAILGGKDPTYQSTIILSHFMRGGGIDTFIPRGYFPQCIAYHQAVYDPDNGWTYVLGGETPLGVTSTNYMVYIMDENSIISTINVLPAPVKNHSACYWKGYVYSIGGENSGGYTDAVYRSAVQADGTLGTWISCSSLPLALSGHRTVVNRGRIYVIGGDNLFLGRQSTVYYSYIQPNGELGSWNLSTALPEILSNAAVAIDSGYIYVIGGLGKTGQKNDVYSCKLFDEKENIDSWRSGPYTNTGVTSSVVWNGRIYLMNGSHLQYSSINDDGSIGDLIEGTALPVSLWNYSLSVWNGRLYVTGGGLDRNGQSAGYYVYYSEISSDGSNSVWKSGNQMPNNVSFHSSVVWNNRIYVSGGYNGFTQTGLYYSTISSDGSLGRWTTIFMPTTVRAHASVVNNGYLYIIGGVGETQQNTVFYVKINNDGSLGGWKAGVSLPAKICGHAAVVYKNQIYVIGGADDKNNILKTVYYSQINTYDGSLKFWENTTNIPVALCSHSAVIGNNRIYVTGGAYSQYMWYAPFMILDPSTDFKLRVKYSDIDGQSPMTGYPKAYVYKGGTLIDTYTMSSEESGSYATGKIYSVSPYYYMPGYDYTYRFEAYDDSGLIALGTGTTLMNGPYISQDTEYGLSQFKATAGDKQVQLSWFTTGNPWYVGTMIRRRTDHYPTSTSDGTQIYWYNGRTYTDTNLSNGVTYYYTAFVQDALNQLTVAQNAMATPCYSKNVQNIVVAPGDKSVRLTWTNPVGADYSATKILRRTDRYPTGPTDGSVIYWYNGTTCVDNGLTNGQTYYYGVFAHDTSYSYATGAFKSAYLNYNSTDGDFNSPSDTTNWAFQLPGNVNLMPTVSWLSSYNGRTGIMRINYSSQTEGLKLTGIPRLGASAANNWYRLRIQYSSDSPNAGHEIFTQMLSYANPQSYVITELGGDWTGNGQMTPNRWYTMDTFVYSEESSHHLQIILKNNGSSGDFYLDSIQCDTVQPPAIVSPVAVPMTIGDFDTASDTTNWAFQTVVDTINGTGTFSWNSTIGTQNGVMALNFNQVNQGVKITSIPTYGIATNRNALLSFKFRSNLSSPTTLHVLGYLYGERDVATFKVDLARKGVLGNFSGNQWNTVYVPLTSVSGNTSFRLQLVVKNNTQSTESVYLDDVQLCYSSTVSAMQQWVELMDESNQVETKI